MTEERMIRVTIGPKDRLNGMLWVEDEWGHRREVDIYDTELAPPKDFEPKCARMDRLNSIKGIHTEPKICSIETCLVWENCPHRERD
jgi:hypothetical protein